MSGTQTRFCLLLALLLLGGSFPAVCADDPLGSVELHWNDESVKLDAATQTDLCAQALRIVESSNFNSTMENFGQLLDIPAYHKLLAGNYLTVTFPLPRLVKTHGNDIVVSKIIIGLNRPEFAEGVFTIDGTGSVAGHGKYSGTLCVVLRRAVQKQLMK